MRGWGLLSKAKAIEKQLSEIGVEVKNNLDFSNWTNEELKELIHCIDHDGKIPSKYQKRLDRMKLT